MTGLQVLGPVLPGLSAVFGLLIGSFLNVVVHRVPAGQSVVSPPSACPACGHTIRRRDNVPVLSWLVLRGRCRDCTAPISARYPAVELTTAVLFGLTALVVVGRSPAGTTQDTVAQVVVLVALLYLMAISVALTLIDIATHTLPNAIVYPSGIVLAVLLVVASAADGDWSALGRAAIGALGSGVLYLGLALAVPGGMGLGDVKLAAVLGLVLAYLGWGPLAVGAFGAFLVGGTVAIALLLAGRARWRGGLPFGPSMLVGAWLGIVFGDLLWTGYLQVLGVA
ncbi:prepilin peptidase [Curtobacterium flaccumfaciens]|uniref:prepilin peptidase n=1 Tax=Curtobacterium flaccumfaciens TaxID=2035 RepID=UPI001BDDFF65|nr:A24 family peptidase [Curtobacterium flaccumfaciens]MBT1605595.1 A24 family peptidase [Curtobacterium flaccumfaciens pv. betae]MBT1656374.1 A24 family peptidase [Curtobacterium flaccumfaciens pv. betae]MCS0470930.1 prepilin peptidase [Curtobacterium flaccumfaciens pv. betae]MCS0475736.1 prepilin peptidase [Curtobacterium flaccumfaciens pv. betae]MCS0477342.1 prepilin peptidase [Curtobacterium flaccumfaciens pv. betae]